MLQVYFKYTWAEPENVLGPYLEKYVLSIYLEKYTQKIFSNTLPIYLSKYDSSILTKVSFHYKAASSILEEVLAKYVLGQVRWKYT